MELITQTHPKRTSLKRAREAFALAFGGNATTPAARLADVFRREDDVVARGWSMTAAEEALVDRVDRDPETGRYFDPEDDVRGQDSYWTAFCGGHGEEIDVAARNAGQARAIAQAAIVLDYSPATIDRIERRDRGVIYF